MAFACDGGHAAKGFWQDVWSMIKLMGRAGERPTEERQGAGAEALESDLCCEAGAGLVERGRACTVTLPVTVALQTCWQEVWSMTDRKVCTPDGQGQVCKDDLRPTNQDLPDTKHSRGRWCLG